MLQLEKVLRIPISVIFFVIFIRYNNYNRVKTPKNLLQRVVIKSVIALAHLNRVVSASR